MLFTFFFFSQTVAAGACRELFLRKNPKKQSLRIQECHFLKIALNLDLTLPDYRSRRELSGSILKIENGALGAELRPFY